MPRSGSRVVVREVRVLVLVRRRQSRHRRRGVTRRRPAVGRDRARAVVAPAERRVRGSVCVDGRGLRARGARVTTSDARATRRRVQEAGQRSGRVPVGRTGREGPVTLLVRVLVLGRRRRQHHRVTPRRRIIHGTKSRRLGIISWGVEGMRGVGVYATVRERRIRRDIQRRKSRTGVARTPPSSTRLAEWRKRTGRREPSRATTFVW